MAGINKTTIISLIALGINLFCLGILIDNLATSYILKSYKEKINILEKKINDQNNC